MLGTSGSGTLPLLPRRQKLNLNYIVTATGWGPGIAVGRGNGTLLEQPHELPHRVCHHNLRVAFDQDIQLRVLACLGFFAGGVKASLGGDGRAGGFQYLCDVGAVGHCPASFFYFQVSIRFDVVEGKTYEENH